MDKETPCWECKHRRSNAFTHHIGCNNPDPKMKGSKHGIENGWFFYPFCFDPVWCNSVCNNFEAGEGGEDLNMAELIQNFKRNTINAISDVISGAVSDAISPNNMTNK